MIVVDTNIITYLFLPTDYTEQAEQLFRQARIWTAPVLWRSEFRNVLALFIRKEILSFEKALDLMSEAEAMMAGNEYEIDSRSTLELVSKSNCSAYVCEFVSLARSLGVKLVAMDKRILKEFPDISVSLPEYFSE